ncbi:DDE_3 domain-containing protein [Trichonephila clavipes]|nr:DDE_3 domain-containing protein [Trichonephila clavipes]
MENARYPLPPENTIERHRYGGAGWLVWRGIIRDSRTVLHGRSVMMTGHIYRDVILEQHVSLFRGARVLNFCLWMTTPVLTSANIVDECLQSEDIITCSGHSGQHTHRT